MSGSSKSYPRVIAVVALCLAFVTVVVVAVAGCGSETATETTVAPTETTVAGTETTAGDGADATGLVGTWRNEELQETIEFTPDGKMIWAKADVEPQTFSYTLEFDTIVFTQPSAPEQNRMPFSLEDGTLKTDDPKYGEVTYTKQ